MAWNQTKKIQGFLRQLNVSGLPVGSWSTCMGHECHYKNCKYNIIEFAHHCFMDCKTQWNVWDFWVRSGKDSQEGMSWKEILSEITPRIRQRYKHKVYTKRMERAWDMLGRAIIWHIWCAWCKLIFKNESMIAKHICHSAWSETIAHRNHIMKFVELRSAQI